MPKRIVSPPLPDLPPVQVQPVNLKNSEQCCNECRYPNFITVQNPAARIKGYIQNKYFYIASLDYLEIKKKFVDNLPPT